MTITCPGCKGTNFYHGDFEDMYLCRGCWTGYEPKELGLEDDQKSGLKQLQAELDRKAQATAQG